MKSLTLSLAAATIFGGLALTVPASAAPASVASLQLSGVATTYVQMKKGMMKKKMMGRKRMMSRKKMM